MFILDNLIGEIGNVAGKYLTNKGDKDKFIAEIKSQELNLKKLIIVEETKIAKTKMALVGKLIEKGCIPLMFYVFIFVQIFNCMAIPILGSFGVAIIPVMLSAEYYSLLKVVVLAIFGKKGAQSVLGGKFK